MSVVIDASSIIAVLLDEPGADFVIDHSRNGFISVVNLAEVYERAERSGLSAQAASLLVGRLDLVRVPFTESLALLTASLRAKTRHKGLSLGDRACLALASERALPALTADRKWADLDLGIDIQLIR